MCQSDSSWFQVAVVTVGDTKRRKRSDIQVFAKASRFGSFLKETVGDLPTPAVETTPAPVPSVPAITTTEPTPVVLPSAKGME